MVKRLFGEEGQLLSFTLNYEDGLRINQVKGGM